MADDLRARVDLDAYLRSRVTLVNLHGGRGYDQGIRIFSCPLCSETRGRGWLNVVRWTAGCWNSGCQAAERLEGGAIEWVRRLEDFNTRGRTWAFLLADYPGTGVPADALAPARQEYCHLPLSYPLGAGVMAGEVLRFLHRQWGVTRATAESFGLRYALQRPFTHRVIIPIREQGTPVSFLARTFRNGTPKYLAAETGQDTGRLLGEVLFNLDACTPHLPTLLVEGAGDAMAWSQRHEARDLPAVALLGQALTPERLALLTLRQPPLLIVALDAEAPAQVRALAHMEDLRAWGLRAVLGAWVGGKDAGAGARLTWTYAGDDSLESRVRARLFSPRT